MSKRKKLPTELVEAVIDNLTHDGRGVARVEGKTVFVDDALPGEKVRFKYVGRKRSYDEAQMLELLEASPQRVQPKCQHFGVCGGCALQHLNADAQVEFKQNGLISNLKKIGHAEPETVLPPLTSKPWGYRRKARLGARYVIKKERMLVGFRERRTNYLADLHRCEVLHPVLGEKLEALANLLRSLSVYMQVPQVEFSMGDETAALIFRHLEPLTENDHKILKSFGEQTGFQIFLQPKGPDTIHCIYPAQPEPLSYRLDDFDVELQFLPTDFTQVNIDINQQMVARAIDLLELDGTETVMDLFCGIGNFSLPLARKTRHVIAVEGDVGLVQRAQENAQRNRIENVEFHAANLMEDFGQLSWARQQVDKILLDPPRSGAFEVVQYLARFKPRRIVYVSCNPATLARDTEEIVHKQGYRLLSAGVMDMFPHTTHVESIAVFEK